MKPICKKSKSTDNFKFQQECRPGLKQLQNFSKKL